MISMSCVLILSWY